MLNWCETEQEWSLAQKIIKIRLENTVKTVVMLQGYLTTERSLEKGNGEYSNGLFLQKNGHKNYHRGFYRSNKFKK